MADQRPVAPQRPVMNPNANPGSADPSIDKMNQDLIKVQRELEEHPRDEFPEGTKPQYQLNGQMVDPEGQPIKNEVETKDEDR